MAPLILGPSVPRGAELQTGPSPPQHEARPKAPSSTQSLWHVLWAQGWHTVVLSGLDWAGSMQAGEEPEVRALPSGCAAAGTLSLSGEPPKVLGPKVGSACAEEGATQGCPTN